MRGERREEAALRSLGLEISGELMGRNGEKEGKKRGEEKEGGIVPRRGRRASFPVSAKGLEMSSPFSGQGRIGAK